MILLTLGVAILDEHTRLARLETNPPINTALGAAAAGDGCRHGYNFTQQGRWPDV